MYFTIKLSSYFYIHIQSIKVLNLNLTALNSYVYFFFLNINMANRLIYRFLEYALNKCWADAVLWYWSKKKNNLR